VLTQTRLQMQQTTPATNKIGILDTPSATCNDCHTKQKDGALGPLVTLVVNCWDVAPRAQPPGLLPPHVAVGGVLRGVVAHVDHLA
jgi:hypothetical protein